MRRALSEVILLHASEHLCWVTEKCTYHLITSRIPEVNDNLDNDLNQFTFAWQQFFEYIHGRIDQFFRKERMSEDIT